MICGLAHQPYDIAQRSGLFELLPNDCFYLDLSQGIEAAAATP
jgi:SulP family sulfate permease